MRLAWQCRHGEDFKTGCEQCVMSPQTRSERMLESMTAMVRLAVFSLQETAHLPGEPEQVRDALTKQVEHVQVSVQLVTACANGLGAGACPVEFPLRRVAATLSSQLLEAASAVVKARRDLISVRRSAESWSTRTQAWANRQIGDDDG
jgi:hypothetical protein